MYISKSKNVYIFFHEVCTAEIQRNLLHLIVADPDPFFKQHRES